MYNSGWKLLLQQQFHGLQLVQHQLMSSQLKDTSHVPSQLYFQLVLLTLLLHDHLQSQLAITSSI